MQQPPVYDSLPMTEVGPPVFVRLTFPNIEGDRFYFIESRRVIRDVNGDIEYIARHGYIAFVDKRVENWKTDHEVKLQFLTSRRYLKIHPNTNENIGWHDYVDAYGAEMGAWERFWQLPDARNEAGRLISDEWEDIAPINLDQHHYGVEDYLVNADLDADDVMAFYRIPNGGRRRNTRRNHRNRRNRRHTRHTRHPRHPRHRK